jgi:hypothetical protein
MLCLDVFRPRIVVRVIIRPAAVDPCHLRDLYIGADLFSSAFIHAILFKAYRRGQRRQGELVHCAKGRTGVQTLIDNITIVILLAIKADLPG